MTLSTSRPASTPSDSRRLDAITLGRVSVDLYGKQVGARLEDTASFQKYVGGSPANMAIGMARLGLRVAFQTRVGNEPFGRYIREQMQREGVSTDAIVTDPDRLTALAVLGIRDTQQFPLIFYRENCADMALSVEDIDPDLYRQTRCVIVTGTHFSTETTRAASTKAMELAKKTGGETGGETSARVVFDIDYRPALWGLAGLGDGEQRYIQSQRVTARLQEALPWCDLVVGTEEEFAILGGHTDPLKALQEIRRLRDIDLVLKTGPRGSVFFPAGGEIRSLQSGHHVQGFPVTVFNVLGAGDAFMAGLMRGYLRQEPWETSLKWANACGAFAVSRHGCAPSIPTWDELSYFLEHGTQTPELRKDARLEQRHWATTRRYPSSQLRVFAFDHRAQLEAIATQTQSDFSKISVFKKLCLAATKRVAEQALEKSGGSPGTPPLSPSAPVSAPVSGYGFLCDERYGQEALFEATETHLWCGRPVEKPVWTEAHTDLELEISPDFGTHLAEWPVDHVIKCLCFTHPEEPADKRQKKIDILIRLFRAARQTDHELLLEIIADKAYPRREDTEARLLQEIYDNGLYPDWWKLQAAETPGQWEAITQTIARNDPYCRGILLLGLAATEAAMAEAFNMAKPYELVRGFAIGRTILDAPARAWFAGTISDETAVEQMAKSYARLCRLWDARA